MSNAKPGPAAAARHQIQGLMAQETSLYEALIKHLEQEQQALLTLEIDSLAQTVTDKNAVLDRLLTVRAARRDYLTRGGNADRTDPSIPPGLGALIAQHQRQLASLNARVATINSQNRALINDGLEIIKQFMDIVTGARSGPRTYQQRGQLATGTVESRFNYQV